MANSELYNKSYKIPKDILASINSTIMSNSNNNGIKRAKTLVKNGYVTYQSLKRLKNFFDYFNTNNGDKIQYALAGGDRMRNFVETTLNSERSGVKQNTEIKREFKTNPNSELKPYQTPRLNESTDNIKRSSTIIIVNKDNKILLLKRGDVEDIWMPRKWALVGGGIEKDETPEEACKREVTEETGLEIEKTIESFMIKRGGDSEEYVFTCRYEGDDYDVELDFENSGYGWFDVSEIEFLDTVPQLMEYLKMVFKKYD